MNEMLRRAAETGDIEMLYRSIHNDPCILDRIDQRQFVESPLLVALSHDQVLFAMEIIVLKPSFARKLNLDLHLALQNRPQTTEMVNRLVRVDSDLVRVRGREGVIQRGKYLDRLYRDYGVPPYFYDSLKLSSTLGLSSNSSPRSTCGSCGGTEPPMSLLIIVGILWGGLEPEALHAPPEVMPVEASQSTLVDLVATIFENF
ncbi:hypothetical protein G4B88_014675 [Cannabis sativa]|uniref:Uncharacterized protein n=1 Tax=Cannabis sativa TaxID=3483 RepID=A0A7J6IB32_CANSA|nr:hypothetical protein G4B88_014675 [Cannabis sativa]